MSKVTDQTELERKSEQKTLTSYIVGFILSLIFTLIPYYLVVNQTVKGTALLLVIMSFAVIQMIVQITFFLHLGRGPKPNWNFFFFISTIGIVLVVVAGSIVIINNLHYNMQPSDQVKKLINDENIYQVSGQKTGACHELHENHVIIISGNNVNPGITKARLCDTLTFKNVGDKSKIIIFGQLNKTKAYAGLKEIELQNGKNETITLSEMGTHTFFYLNEGLLRGAFSVQ